MHLLQQFVYCDKVFAKPLRTQMTPAALLEERKEVAIERIQNKRSREPLSR